jgi:plasmid stability protein
MAQFLIRNLEDDVHQKLRELAHSQGQSLEEFVRETLRRTALERAAKPAKLGSKIAQRFTKIGLQEPIQELRGQPLTPPSFE